MSGTLLRWVCTGAVVGSLFTASPAEALPAPAPDRSVRQLLTDLQRLYREAEEASEKYNATAEKLKKQRAKAADLRAKLKRARASLKDSKGDAARLARQQYQGASGTDVSSYLRLLLADDPQHALDQGHVVGRVAAGRAATVRRMTGGERKADALAAAAKRAVDERAALTARRKQQRDRVDRRLKEVEELLASLTEEQLASLREAEDASAETEQKRFIATGALGAPAASGTSGASGTSAAPGTSGASRASGASRGGKATRAPSKRGHKALTFAVRQIGRPYKWGAEGPRAFDCSGLTSRAWERAGRDIPRTSQEQWKRLRHIPLSRLRPGDLVVYFPKATHVAMYLGGGKVVQAPRPGTRVKVSPIAANPVLGAVRPDPGGRAIRGYSPPKLPKGAFSGSNLGYGDAQAPGARESR
ncbi:C40 family peptidase [Streptomyces flavofungini]|uniref:C40 family peptidase n=1 Tax=Streptomyces flavofungini TaxID=68200 RepID=UPI0034DFD22A